MQINMKKPYNTYARSILVACLCLMTLLTQCQCNQGLSPKKGSPAPKSSGPTPPPVTPVPKPNVPTEEQIEAITARSADQHDQENCQALQTALREIQQGTRKIEVPIQQVWEEQKKVNFIKYSVLLAALMHDCDPQLLQTLIELGADVNTKEPCFYEAPILGITALTGSFESIKWVLDHGVNVRDAADAACAAGVRAQLCWMGGTLGAGRGESCRAAAVPPGQRQRG